MRPSILKLKSGVYCERDCFLNANTALGCSDGLCCMHACLQYAIIHPCDREMKIERCDGFYGGKEGYLMDIFGGEGIFAMDGVILVCGNW